MPATAAAGARAIEVGPHPVTVIVMDDGLQNPTLAKSLTIAVVDGVRGIGNGLVMPAGPLRAALVFQLELTDAVVVVERAAAPADAGAVTDWLRHRFAGPVLRGRVVPADDVQWMEGSRVVAWAGIGAPERFFAMLRALRAEVVEAVALRDRRWVQRQRARRLLDAARRHQATIVTTEKDIARLSAAAAPAPSWLGTPAPCLCASNSRSRTASAFPRWSRRRCRLLDGAATPARQFRLRARVLIAARPLGSIPSARTGGTDTARAIG